MSPRERYWERIPLEQMSRDEWDRLCDGCGKCCLNKLMDEDTDEVYYTEVACRLLDAESCRCLDYRHRKQIVDDCMVLEPAKMAQLDWLPATCAYRLLAHNKPLPQWHYLVCGDREAVHKAGQSVRGKTLSEEFIHPSEFEQHIIEWVE